MAALLSRVAVAIALLATPMTPVAEQAAKPSFTATAEPAGGLGGTAVQVTFEYHPPPVINYRAAAPVVAITGCEFSLDDADRKSGAGCRGEPGDKTWTMDMPKTLTAGTHQVYWTLHYTLDQKPFEATDSFGFEAVKPAFRTTVEPAAVNPGQPVDVRFTSETDGVNITRCSVQGIKCHEDRRGWFARITAPVITSFVTWKVGFTGGPNTDDTASDEVRINVEPWPAPQFQVAIAGSDRVEPGEPVTVRFESLTTGVDVKTCFVTYRGGQIDCTGDLATVMLPGEAGPVELPWTLTFGSSRQGEKGGERKGTVGFTVADVKPDFAVTVQPPAARRGDTVALTFTPLVPGMEIADCIVFFPHAAGDTCRRSPQHRVVRTQVPDLPPGATLLRWAVDSRSAAGRRGADDDVIAYLILPPLPRTGQRTKTRTPPARTRTPATVLGPPPEFVAETRPESAPPGARVTVFVSPLDPDVRIAGCAVVFSGGGDHVCRHSGGRWSVRTTVPAGAPAGETLPLDWRVSFVNPAGARDQADGTTDYPVRGSAPPTPAFEVVAEPAAATGGAEVTVSHNPEDMGVTITGCRVGFTENALTACQQSPTGWTAQLEVPPKMAAGSKPLHWTIAYARSAGPGGTAQGFSSFRVLPTPDRDKNHGWWYAGWGLLWRTALGGVLLAGLVAFRVLRRPILARFRPRPAPTPPDERRPRDDDQDGDQTVAVVPVWSPEEMSVRVDRPDAPPARDIRLRIRRPRLTPHVPEDLP